MEIIVNGESQQVPDDMGVPQLLEMLDLTGRRLALEINHEIVPRSLFATQRLQPGDRVEIVQAIGGG
jgi:sulfur carrier protein